MDLYSSRSSAKKLGLFTILLVLCVGALIFVSMNQTINVSHSRFLSNFHAGNKSGAARPGFNPLTFHHPILDRLGFHGRDMYSMQETPVVSGNSQANVSAHLRPILLIVAYLRTGSTFTASLFAEHPSTFYVFEPLHVIGLRSKKHRNIKMINGTIRYINDVRTHDDLAIQAMQCWMNCSFRGLDRDTLMDSFHYTYSKSMRSFVMCMRQRQARLKASFPSAINTCLPSAISRCAQADLRVFKTIRMRMASVEQLMNLHPNLKVVHLLRDPRGMFMSQVARHFMDKKRDKIKTYCTNIMADIEVSKRLLRERRGNIHVIRYEDIAYDPLKQAERLYRFANMTLNKRIVNYIQRSTSMNLKDNCPYCTRRSNSTKTANSWRNKINSSLLREVDTNCQDVYKNLGFIPLRIEDVKNDSIPSMSTMSLHELLTDNTT